MAKNSLRTCGISHFYVSTKTKTPLNKSLLTTTVIAIKFYTSEKKTSHFIV